jgi:hypothetical protein
MSISLGLDPMPPIFVNLRPQSKTEEPLCLSKNRAQAATSSLTATMSRMLITPIRA